MAQNERWQEYYRDEQDAAFLYRALAEVERDDTRRNLFARMATVEDRHVDRWAELFAQHHQAVPTHHPSRRARLLAWVARRAGPSVVLPLVLVEEGREVAAYLALAESTPHEPMHTVVQGLAAESAEHARELAKILSRQTEPWHAAGAGGYLRVIVYGFNDGLTANFGLVAGVIGASVQPHIVVITGVAGAIADALSMGASGYLAATSEAEVQAHQIDMERRELELMPEIEEEELALIYEAKGLTRDRARDTARAMMQDPTRALAVKKREELNLKTAELAPALEGWVTGTATAIGALIPILPFLLMSAGAAMWMSLTVSMLAHFGVGAARAFFTGRGIWVSGRDMFVVGFGVAAVGYLIGQLLTQFL